MIAELWDRHGPLTRIEIEEKKRIVFIWEARELPRQATLFATDRAPEFHDLIRSRPFGYAGRLEDVLIYRELGEPPER